MKNKNFEKELPKGYKPIYQLDAEDKKTITIINIASLILFAIIVIPLFIWLRSTTGKPLYDLLDIGILKYLMLIVIYICYIFAHELTHGVAYYALTQQKLTFGTAKFVAFCGVPKIFVYRRTSIIAALAPFIVYDAVFGLGIVFAVSYAWKVVWILALSVHVGGCVGDLWGAVLLIFRFKNPKILVKDTGPKQTFYAQK